MTPEEISAENHKRIGALPVIPTRYYWHAAGMDEDPDGMWIQYAAPVETERKKDSAEAFDPRPAIPGARTLAYELEGVVSDWRRTETVDFVGIETIKRVRDALYAAPVETAAEPGGQPQGVAPTQPVYVLEQDELDKLKAISDRLHARSDRERDEGHKLWLLWHAIADRGP